LYRLVNSGPPPPPPKHTPHHTTNALLPPSLKRLPLQIGGKRSVVMIDPTTQERTLVAEVPMDNPLAPSWVHDLPASENYIIVPDTPIVNDITSLKVLHCPAWYIPAGASCRALEPGSASSLQLAKVFTLRRAFV